MTLLETPPHPAELSAPLVAPASVEIRNILLATDFSLASETALVYATDIARRHRAKLFLAHILPNDPHAVPVDPAPRELDARYREANQKLVALAERAELRHIDHELLLQQGDTALTLALLVEDRGLDLAVAGTHARGGINKMLFGSVAEELFRIARCPVIVLGPHVPVPPRPLAHILFATDFGEGSLHAFRHAVAFARESRARLTLLHVNIQPFPVAMPPAIEFGSENLAAWEANTRQDIMGRFQRLLASAGPLPIHPELRVASHYLIADGILREAADADLIVMGAERTHSIKLSSHLPPWTMLHDVVVQANCPVLTVRA